MNPLSSRTRALLLGFSLSLTLALAACGGGTTDQTTATPLAPVIHCAL
jgi:hypothetical protein